MTIASFCHDLLLTEGPLPLETLAARAADAAVTRARDPEAAVRSAIGHRELQLRDGRWSAALPLLEGRVLTARRLPLRRQGAYGLPPDGTDDDLMLIQRALRSGPVPLAGGGELRQSGYHREWVAPRDWSAPEPGVDELLTLRVRDGALHVGVVPVDQSLAEEGQRLADIVGPDDLRLPSWAYDLTDRVEARLWHAIAADPDLLIRPAPPLSECIPLLADRLREQDAACRRRFETWTTTVELPGDLQAVALREARRSGQVLLDWLTDVLVRELSRCAGWDDLDGCEDDADDTGGGQLLWLPGRSIRPC